MNKKILGSFYLKRTVNGNLYGEFTNETTTVIFTESADLVSGNDSFIGVYNSTWREENMSVISQLKIGFIEGTNGLKYKLLWQIGNNIIFNGEGFLVDKILIGHYQAT